MLRLVRLLQSFFCLGHGTVLLVFLILLSVFLRKSSDSTRENIVTGALASVYYPGQRILSSVNQIRSLDAENERLKKENARLRMETINAREGLKELARLHELVHFDNKWDYPIVTARVVGRSPGRLLTTLVVNRGRAQGIHENMPVFTVRGLVGRVARVSETFSRVQLLVDPNMKLSVIEERTRVVGFLEGSDGVSLFAMIPANTGVKVGDTLVTSGLGGLYPKGIGVGIVRVIHQGDVDVMCHLSVEPFQNFSRLEELFIMQKEPDWTVQEMLAE